MQITLMSLSIFLAATTVNIDDVSFDTQLKTPGAPLELAGGSGFTYALIFDVLSGATYLPQGIPASDFSKASTKALVLVYKRDFSAAEFREVTENLFRKNNAKETVQRYQTELKAFNALYQDLKAGDRYQLTLLANEGIELKVNNRVAGTIENPSFGQALFNIWFGPAPFNKSFRDNLLKAI